jgi:hypothetical protein
MASLVVKIKPKSSSKPRKFQIELDADKFERLAADFGMFNPDFVKSLERAEIDYRAGRTKKIVSLKQLRSR